VHFHEVDGINLEKMWKCDTSMSHLHLTWPG